MVEVDDTPGEWYQKFVTQSAAGMPPDAKKPLTWDELVSTTQRLTIDVNGNRASKSGFDAPRVKRYALDPSRGQWWKDGRTVAEAA